MRDIPVFNKINYFFLALSLAFISAGCLLMSLDSHPYGYGFIGLTLGPVILISGFILPFFAIFYTPLWVKKQTTLQERYTRALGWFVFIISFGVYTYTAEPTTSFWDCGEFIAAACKLQIPHPPGAPLFLLIGRIFSLLAPDKEWIAFSVNMVSVTASAFTCLILYLTIVLLINKFNKTSSETGSVSAPLTIIAALCGSLAFAFTDSFWFNATEAEVYALSCFFTALAFWGIVKWESQAGNTGSEKWLLFIAYITGLSTGVHLLNLLALPALVFVFYFKKYTFTWKGSFIAMLVSLSLIALVIEGIMIGVPSLAGAVEVFFINMLGLPFNSGILFFCFLLLCIVIALLWYANQKHKLLLHTISLCFILILTGYLSYLIVLIRSSYNTPLDENDPNDVMSLILYLKRDQYGSRPLLKGPYFTAGYPERVVEGAARYRKDPAKHAYVVYDHDYNYVYNAKQTTLFPRLHSTEPRHAEAYRHFLGLKEGEKPSMRDNLHFLFAYQIGHQYWRYFMWNFAGRVSNHQDASWLKPSDWFSKDIPDFLRYNKARNNYFLLPLLFGLAGCYYQLRKRKKDAFLVFLLFFFGGIAIILYLNQPPVEPRERDYTFVGSFYAFCIWMSFGILAVHAILKRITGSILIQMGITLLPASIIPAILLSQNWDDHNRKGRYFAEDSARNVINACPSQAILFTAADNDTFPLWWLQEAMDYRTDVRICNLSLLNMDWYIKGMKEQCNTSLPLPGILDYADYMKGKNEHIYPFQNIRLKKGIDLATYIQLIKQQDPLVAKVQENTQTLTVLPSEKIFLKVNKNDASKNLNPSLFQFFTERMEFIIPDGLTKSALVVLDIIQANHWKRPVYFNYSAVQDFPYLKPYLQKEGFIYRLLPVKIPGQEGWLDTERMYSNLMKNAVWRGMASSEIYIDPAAGPFVAQSRMEFYTLSAAYFQKGEKAKAKKILLHALSILPDKGMPFDYTIIHYIDMLFKLNENKMALELTSLIGQRSIDLLTYYQNRGEEYDKDLHIYMLYELTNVLRTAGEKDHALIYNKAFEKFYL